MNINTKGTFGDRLIIVAVITNREIAKRLHLRPIRPYEEEAIMRDHRN